MNYHSSDADSFADSEKQVNVINRQVTGAWSIVGPSSGQILLLAYGVPATSVLASD